MSSRYNQGYVFGLARDRRRFAVLYNTVESLRQSCIIAVPIEPQMQDKHPNVLEEYVAESDPSFAWQTVRRCSGAEYDIAILELTSQTWLSASQHDRSIWKHWLTIVVPKSVDSKKCMLWIVGGASSDPSPTGASERLVHMAVSTKSIVAELSQVPNQPIRFTARPDTPYSEDDLIAFLQSQYGSGDRTALARLPMVKSVTAGMSAIQEWWSAETHGARTVDGFIISGASKRGWTAWLAGLVDQRVVGVAPTVINVLNVNASIIHHWESLGHFSSALSAYLRHQIIPDQIGTAKQDAINAIEDPISYVDQERMRIPKFIINAAGDEYFPPDSTQFSYPLLPGPKWLRMIPNCRHSMEGTDVNASIATWHNALIGDRPLPKCTWELRNGEDLFVRTSVQPTRALLWKATNTNARDFRFNTIGPGFTSSELFPDQTGDYLVKILAPLKGFSAYFVEFQYQIGLAGSLKLTTEIYIRPDLLPFNWRSALSAHVSQVKNVD